MSDTEMAPRTMEGMLEFLSEALKLDVETTSEYTGGMDGGDMYKNFHTIQLKLNGEVISSVSL